MSDFERRYKITVWATVNGGDQLCRGWTFVAQKISEDDAIWNALKEFRRERTATWDGWPRDIFAVLVEPEIVTASILRPPRHRRRRSANNPN